MIAIPKSLFAASYAFRVMYPWRTLKELNLFALRLDDGTMVYCSVAGNSFHEHGLYVIYESGLGDFFKRVFDVYGNRGVFQRYESMMSQDGYAILFGKKVFDFFRTYKEVEAWAEQAGIVLTGKYAYPGFLRNREVLLTGFIDSRRDISICKQALDAANYLLERIKEEKAKGRKFDEIWESFRGDGVLLLERSGKQGFSFGSTDLSHMKRREYAPVPLDFDTDFLQHTRQNDRLMIAEIIMSPEYSETIKEGRKLSRTYSFSMLVVEEGAINGKKRKTKLSDGKATYPLEKFANYIALHGKPKMLFVRRRDSRTPVILKELADKMGLRIRECPDGSPLLWYLRKTEHEYYRWYSKNYIW